MNRNALKISALVGAATLALLAGCTQEKQNQI